MTNQQDQRNQICDNHDQVGEAHVIEERGKNSAAAKRHRKPPRVRQPVGEQKKHGQSDHGREAGGDRKDQPEQRAGWKCGVKPEATNAPNASQAIASKSMNTRTADRLPATVFIFVRWGSKQRAMADALECRG